MSAPSSERQGPPTTLVLRPGPPAVPSDVDALVAVLIEEMLQAWRRSERPRAEDFLTRHPELTGHPEAAAELIYEEVCLRQEHGEDVSVEEVLQRFPQWRAKLEVLFDCQRLLGPSAAAPHLPAPGELLGDFLVLAELGRGGHGSVFLATQASLADRPVVLKLTPFDGFEHLSLARLQHTHIVPLHSVQDFPDRSLRALCMPFFGGATLAQLLAALRDRPPALRTSRDLLGALDRLQEGAAVALPSRGPARDVLARASYVRAICWIGACLAEALQYAHERGIVHLDLKPSNVLLTADGLPMLLDFHVARAPLAPGAPAPCLFGGTPSYMSPEQEEALAALEQGLPMPRPVDGRSDVYSLGAMLYEALSGALPGPGAPRPLRQVVPEVSPGLDDVLSKCLAADPDRRYAEMAGLAEDHRRHLAHLPLRGVRNRSLRERWRKWRQRRPNGLAAFGMLAAVLGAVCALGIGTALHFADRTARARGCLRTGQAQLTEGQNAEAAGTFQRGLSLVRGLPGQSGLAEDLGDGLRAAEDARAEADQARAVQALHSLADRARFLHGVGPRPSAELRRLESACRALWERREPILKRVQAAGPPNWNGRRVTTCSTWGPCGPTCSIPRPRRPARRKPASRRWRCSTRRRRPWARAPFSRRSAGFTREAWGARRACAGPGKSRTRPGGITRSAAPCCVPATCLVRPRSWSAPCACSHTACGRTSPGGCVLTGSAGTRRRSRPSVSASGPPPKPPPATTTARLPTPPWGAPSAPCSTTTTPCAWALPSPPRR